MVEIKGEVVRPGVYSIEGDKRLNDLLILAGGKTANAELRHINLAKRLKDGDSFYIPFVGEPVGSGTGQGSGMSGTDEEKGKIDLNEATREELMTVPGIGPATADNILRYRESAGGFQNIEDLLEVDRIGDKTLEKLKEYLEVR
ncbi:MAG TPA: ComEA family DNA-binding protein [Clostridiaceae bacterium]|nr:ComEA family DNA-binding protein [Clostridiaceae bacterium]